MLSMSSLKGFYLGGPIKVSPGLRQYYISAEAPDGESVVCISFMVTKDDNLDIFWEKLKQAVKELQSYVQPLPDMSPRGPLGPPTGPG